MPSGKTGFRSEKKGDYLFITGEGVRTDLTAMIEGTRKIYEAALENRCDFLLVDYSKVRFDVPLAEAYNIVKIYEGKMPEFSKIVMAIVVKRIDWELAKFWESISQKRGYSFRIFARLDEARSWLMEEIKSRSVS